MLKVERYNTLNDVSVSLWVLGFGVISFLSFVWSAFSNDSYASAIQVVSRRLI